MEYCNEGTLEELSKVGLTESLIRRYTRELVIAIEYLHEHNIIHRDIKGTTLTLMLPCNISHYYSPLTLPHNIRFIR